MDNSLVTPGEGLLLSQFDEMNMIQRALPQKLEDTELAMQLFERSIVDRARLMSVSSSRASAWLSVALSLGLALSPTEMLFDVVA